MEIRYSKVAMKTLAKLNVSIASKIIDAIEGLTKNPLLVMLCLCKAAKMNIGCG